MDMQFSFDLYASLLLAEMWSRERNRLDKPKKSDRIEANLLGAIMAVRLLDDSLDNWQKFVSKVRITRKDKKILEIFHHSWELCLNHLQHFSLTFVVLSFLILAGLDTEGSYANKQTRLQSLYWFDVYIFLISSFEW